MKHGLLFCCVVSLSAMVQPTYASSLKKIDTSYTTSDYAKTKYPIVLVHGWGLGFSRLGTKTFGLDYFYQITPDLARNGTTLFVASLSVANSTEVRGEQLLKQVDEVRAITGIDKVNLIGHSHGGPTIQYIEGVAPEKVASLTAVAGAMKGTQVANSLQKTVLVNPIAKTVMTYIVAPAIQLAEGAPELTVDYDASVNSLTIEGVTAFNDKYPTAAIPQDCNSRGEKLTSNGVYHYSWMGRSQVTNILDPDTIIELATTALMGKNQGPHDGLVSICSGNYGQVIRNDYNWNHFDEVNQFLGLRGLFSQDPVSAFRQHANRLKLQGL